MIHYEYLNKPSKLFRFSENRYLIDLTVDRLMYINEFIKKYTGLDIEKNPMLYGDILIFTCHARNYHANKTEGIIVEGLSAGTTVIVRFKKDDVIVSTKIAHADHYAEETEIKSDKPWTYHDIEIFVNDELVYLEKDISYIRHIQLNMHLAGPGKKIKLNKIAESYTIERKDKDQISNIGDLPNELEELISTSATEIKKRINAERPDEQVVFIKPGEHNKAMDLIGKVMQTANDAIWIFDSYFTDINGIRGMLDWINILANCRAHSKNIIFYSKNQNNALDIEALKREIENDAALSAMIRMQKLLGIHFYQTKAPIHDRFVLTETDRINTGLSMGTSFNSLGDHHYCIFKLSHKASQNIWNELKSWMIDENNLLKHAEV